MGETKKKWFPPMPEDALRPFRGGAAVVVMADGSEVRGKLADIVRVALDVETEEGLVTLDKRQVQYVLVGEPRQPKQKKGKGNRRD